MPIMQILITLIVAGVILWLVNSYIPMDGKIKKILNVVVTIVVILWLLSVFGDNVLFLSTIKPEWP